MADETTPTPEGQGPEATPTETPPPKQEAPTPEPQTPDLLKSLVAERDKWKAKYRQAREAATVAEEKAKTADTAKAGVDEAATLIEGFSGQIETLSKTNQELSGVVKSITDARVARMSEEAKKIFNAIPGTAAQRLIFLEQHPHLFPSQEQQPTTTEQRPAAANPPGQRSAGPSYAAEMDALKEKIKAGDARARSKMVALSLGIKE